MSTPVIERIKEIIDQKGLTYEAAAKAAGLERSYFRKLFERGGNSPRGDTLQKIAAGLGVGVAELLPVEKPRRATKPRIVSSFDPDAHDHDSPNETPMTMGSETGLQGVPADASAQIDVTGGMGGGGLSIVSEGVPGRHGMTFAAEHVRDYWRLPPAILIALGLAAQDVAIIPVQGDSMQPTLDEGDVVFIDTRHRWPSPPGLYAVLDEIGGVVVKRLEVSSKPGAEQQLVSVMSDNPRHATKEWNSEDLFIVGRVLRKFGTVR